MKIDISVKDQRWDEIPFDAKIVMTDVTAKILDFVDVPDYATEISVVLCDDPFIQRLNNEYRNKDKPTNVLSFPQLGADHLDPSSPEMALETSLGDIIISYDTIIKEAEEQEKTLEDHFRHMFLHGTLHLLGYDHIEEDEAEEMETLEIEILSDMGIENPYSDAQFMA